MLASYTTPEREASLNQRPQWRVVDSFAPTEHFDHSRPGGATELGRRNTMRRVSAPTVLIMAAGQGTRMKSAVPKVLHPVCGRALVAWPIEAAREAGAGRMAVIVSPDRDISGALPDGVESIPQPEANGTGGALLAAADAVAESETVLVLSGDVPLVSAELIAEIVATHEREGAAATVVTAVLDDPGSYGRVVRSADGAEVERIVEAKAEGDATEASSRSTRSTPASTSSTARPWRRPFRSSPTTTRRASTTCPTCCRCCARRGVASPPTSRPTRT